MSNLDMSLDDIIKMKMEKQQQLSSPPPHFGPAPSRRFFNRIVNRSSPYSHVEAPETKWKHDMFSQYAATSYSPMLYPFYYVQTGTKILVSNLDYEVSDDDIKDLFSVVGDVKKISVHYDKSGRSEGTAEIVYSQWKDAEAAVKRYNSIQLDGKPMEVKIVGMVTTTSAVMSPYGSYGLRRDEESGSELIGLIQGGNMHTRGRGLGRRHGEKAYENISAEELDADLDKYRAEAMQTR
ncbi:THO complex subunit 4 [Heracleum sosnowskyi]|uniref:THO complex subunit 4 n=1 Tax=Heracleum sosnowskyi TaxID=360622 RepID=A0AAD8JJ37_9APIA|nr:THO complex subunit 4 [Heracleum sosnowskyi]